MKIAGPLWRLYMSRSCGAVRCLGLCPGISPCPGVELVDWYAGSGEGAFVCLSFLQDRTRARMNKADRQDKANRLSATVANSLDAQTTTRDLARQAYQSRTQFHRLFRTVVEETPGAMRRRLLLERAAYQLEHTGRSVTDIALDANYSSLEAFTRAFRKSFRSSPSIYRRLRDLHFHLPASNRIHFFGPGSLTEGEKDMDLFDRFAGNDSWHTRRLLEYACTLTEEQLDRPLPMVVELLPWRESNKTLRQLLENIIFTKEVWSAALSGAEMDVSARPNRSAPRRRCSKGSKRRMLNCIAFSAIFETAAAGMIRSSTLSANRRRPSRTAASSRTS